MPGVIAEGTVYAGAPDAGDQSCCWPGIAVLPGGRWLCGFRAAPLKNGTRDQKVCLCSSDDDGSNWTMPIEPFIAPDIAGRTGFFRGCYLTALGGDSVLIALYWVERVDPSLPFFNEETEGLLDSRIFLARSEDAGATWSAPWLIETPPYDNPTPVTGPVLSLPDGELACQFETNKTYYDTTPWQHASVLSFSRDGGQNWTDCSVVATDPVRRFFYWDQRPNVLADGTLLDVFWTYDNQLAAYLNIHACESLDNGRTWSAPWDIGVPGQPTQPVSLFDGRIAMAYVDRTGAPVIKLRTSADRGRSWPESSEIVLARAEVPNQTTARNRMQDAWSEMGKFSLGLPNIARLPAGEVLVVYYTGPTTDHTAIKWVRVRP